MMRVATVILLVGGLLLWKAFRAVLLAPWLISRALKKQGVQCMPYQLSLGTLRVVEFSPTTRSSSLALRPPHTVTPLIAPHYYEWKNLYGDLFVFWVGYRAVLPITNPEQMKEILYNKSGHFEKPTLRADAGDLMGQSVSSLKGERWALHRRIVSPAFFYEKLKGMTPAIIACTESILDKWQSELESQAGKEVDVYEDFKMLTSDIIAHCAFGSSYEEGRQVFKLQQEQQNVVLGVLQSIYIPGVRHLPTSRNQYARQLKKRIEASVHDIIMRRGKDYSGNDLLGILMDANREEHRGSQKNSTLTLQEIVDECKTFFFAGQETTATLLTWAFLLLARHPYWQEKAREEVLHVCGKEPPAHDSVHSLKLAGMILNEALRLYPPVPYITREATKKTMLGSICVPAKTMFLLPIIDFQYDQAWWGDDAQYFNPERFADGMRSACKTPVAFCPFSVGPRNCLGQNFAMLEARVILSMMLQRFTFTLSPGYIHCPVASITLRPQHGMQIIFKKLEY
ncbi:hypothetical protein GOP47_0029851 [Adiantum capillus-veneris]|nr:hypothetical protein GOP47_0029851 [Adiantum capillus-veneris]